MSVLTAALLVGSHGSAGAQSQPACDQDQLAELAGKYQGQTLGFRSIVTVTSMDADRCSLSATFVIARSPKVTAEGRMTLQLDDDVLTGTWSTVSDNGTVRFAIRRGGEHWNGSMSGGSEQPSGPWDLVKIIQPKTE